jgi:hypothetical protein
VSSVEFDPKIAKCQGYVVGGEPYCLACAPTNDVTADAVIWADTPDAGNCYVCGEPLGVHPEP